MEFIRQAIEWLHWLKDWTLIWAATDYAVLALFIISFTGSSFFPLPPDFLFLAMAIASPKAAIFYAFVCLLGSTLGGIFGYFIGLKGGKPILLKFVSEERVKEIHNYFEKYEEWAIGIAGFTPLPYKIFAISAGVFYIDFWRFVLISTVSRGARFFLVAVLILVYGEQIRWFIDNHFNTVTIAAVLMLAGGMLVMKFIKVPHSKKEETDAKAEEGIEIDVPIEGNHSPSSVTP